jgi:hypothetical protein
MLCLRLAKDGTVAFLKDMAGLAMDLIEVSGKTGQRGT